MLRDVLLPLAIVAMFTQTLCAGLTPEQMDAAIAENRKAAFRDKPIPWLKDQTKFAFYDFNTSFRYHARSRQAWLSLFSLDDYPHVHQWFAGLLHCSFSRYSALACSHGCFTPVATATVASPSAISTSGRFCRC